MIFKIRKLENKESGFSMLDVLLAMMFLGLVLGSYAGNSVSTYQGVDKASRYSSALSIAEQNLENLLQVNPLTLDDSDDLQDTIVQDGVSFTRNINITVNSNGSRFIEVEITALNASKYAKVKLEHTSSLWGAL